MDIGALTSHPLAAVVSESALPRSAVFPIHVRGVIRSLNPVGVLALRAELPVLNHQICNPEPVVILRVVGLVADRTSAATHFEVCHALRRISSHVGGSLGADFHVVVLPLAITTGMHGSDCNGVNHFSGSLCISAAFQFL